MANLFVPDIKTDTEAQARVREWIAALRSDDYKQTQSRLAKEVDGERRFCCLGVACDLHDSSKWILAPWDSGQIRYQTEAYNEAYGLPLEVQRALHIVTGGGDYLMTDAFVAQAALTTDNDGGKSFAEIADIIERELELAVA